MRRKSQLNKTGSGPGHPPPVAGESLNRPDESKLSSIRFLLFPLVVLRTPALICDQRVTEAMIGCGNQTQREASVR